MMYVRALVAAALLLVAVNAPSAGEKRLSVYSPGAAYAVSVTGAEGRDYVGLLDLLEPLGPVAARMDGKRWKLKFGRIDAEFTPGKREAKIGGKKLDLPAGFVLLNDRGYVPLSFLGALLSRFLPDNIQFHELGRRLFIGDVTTTFTAALSKTAPSQLVLNFSAPVSPSIATEPGKLRMTFTRDPLVPPGALLLTFPDPRIASATYEESNGAAEVAVNGNVPLMAHFSNGGRTITVAPAPAQNVAAAPPAPATAAPSVPAASPPAPAPSEAPRLPVVVIDAAHGGDEAGAALTAQLPEKDVTLALARALRHELAARGFAVVMTRDSDIAVPLDDRAAKGNTAGIAAYISLHASSEIGGVRIYTALLPPPEGEKRGALLDWNTAQGRALSLSRAYASAVAAELQKQQLPARSLSAPLRPLNNVTAPALAIELAPRSSSGAMDLASAGYQNQFAVAVANGIASARTRGPEHPQ